MPFYCVVYGRGLLSVEVGTPGSRNSRLAAQERENRKSSGRLFKRREGEAVPPGGE